VEKRRFPVSSLDLDQAARSLRSSLVSLSPKAVGSGQLEKRLGEFGKAAAAVDVGQSSS